MSDCLFCKMITGEIPVTPVYEDDFALAFNDIDPKAPVHVLVIPKTHVDSVAAVSDPAIDGQVLSAVRAVAQKLSLTDFRIVSNTGAGAGQSVFHWHVHILAGRPLAWPPG